jgi:cytochrome P450
VAVWRGFVGERARTAVYGWSKRAFEEKYLRRTVLGHRIHIPLEPDAVQRVLLDNAANYVKPELVKKLLRPTIGSGLLSSDGELWRAQRKIVAASFAPAAVEAAIPAFAAAASAAAESWSEGERDMAAEATATTMRIISDTLFAGDPRLTSRTAMDHISAALGGVSEARLQVLLGLPLMPWSVRGWRGRRGQKFLRATLEQLVRDRLADSSTDDFLALLIRALHERFPPEQALALAVDNAATFYLAGHETTANALTWALFLLADQPELQDEAAAEARTALGDGADAALPERLPLLRRILDETLRLYPSAPRFDREAVADDRLGEEEVRAGDIVSIWPWLLHRHRRLWDDPDTFDLSRWTAEAHARRHRFQYIPFGGGPRVCVGARFATAEALTILAHWLAGWRFSPVPSHCVRVSGMVTLRPAGGLPLRLRARPASG